MLSLSIACLSGFILATLTLTVAPQDSIAGSSDTRMSSSSPLELLSPSNQSMSSSNSSFPAPPPPLSVHMSALKALGLDPDKPISWETTPSGAMIRVQCNVLYGRRLDYQDCRDAYSQIPRSNDTVVRFAHRQGGWPHDIALPQRYLGSRSFRQEHDSPFISLLPWGKITVTDRQARQRKMRHQSKRHRAFRHGDGKREECRRRGLYADRSVCAEVGWDRYRFGSVLLEKKLTERRRY